MHVLVVEPGYLPYEKEIYGLEQMQAVVGGYIQAIYPYHEEVAIVCNEEGLINGLPFNRSVPGGYGGVFGTFLSADWARKIFLLSRPILSNASKKSSKTPKSCSALMEMRLSR